ncbi:inositol monophosphatase family protein [Salinicola aestuarinus]|uniref:inositol monophosphatase family protein n=1 Tax=Salinicola aestuarinus TaxID=1949082 RepID=UPI000DA1826E|nr:inositol monophosphatase family protein [Salinicola aestuarinus]
MHPMVQYALRAARSAAEQFVRIRDRLEVSHDEQATKSLLQDTARNAETLIVHQLSRGYPQHGVSGRFTPHRDGKGADSETVWHIEPFHGESNLGVGGRQFALSMVCLVKGRPEHAVIVCPFSDDEFLISRGRGAQGNGKRMRVSKAGGVNGARIALSWPSVDQRERWLPQYLTIVERLGPQIETLIGSGCPILDLIEFASGRTDGAFVLGLEEQDRWIGSLLLKESGALSGGIDGSPSLEVDGSLMAAGPKLYKALAQQLRVAV